jgi:hypothetical protein
MKKIYFTCDKVWNYMDSISLNTRFCQDCEKCVTDYSTINSKNPQVNSDCGKFNLSQIESFSRQYSLHSSKAVQLSLMALLGLSLSYNTLSAQNAIDRHRTAIEVSNNELIINGRLINKESKKPLGSGIIELYNKNKMVAVAFTDPNGDFSLSIDTTKNDIKELRVVFDRSHEYSDTTSISNDKFKNIVVELEVKANWGTPEISITGDVTSIDEEKINCRLPKTKK